MNQKYPSDTIDWKQAIKQHDDPNLFSQEYHIPVSYTKIYKVKSERPDLITMEQEMNWLKSQSNVMIQIEESGIPIDRFSWQVRKIIHTNQYGDKVPAVKAIGMATVVNVLQRIEV